MYFRILQSFFLGEFSLILSTVYTILCIIPSFWYYAWYKLYRNEAIEIYDSSIVVIRNEVKKIYESNQIRRITFCTQRKFLRVQELIKVETTLDDVLYITDEINSFKKLKKLLKKNYTEKYIIETQLLSPKNAIS